MPWYRKILAYLIFVPNITLGTNTPGLGRPEIFPWTSMFAFRRSAKVNLGYFVFVAYLLASYGYFIAQGGDVLIGLRSFLALFNASIIFFTLIYCSEAELKYVQRAFWIMFFLNVLFSLGQHFNFWPQAMVRPMNFFIDRWTHTAWEMGRGSSGLFAEPSYFAFGIHHYFAYAMLLLGVKQRSAQGLFLTFAMAAFDLIVVRSLTGLVIMTIYIISHQNWRKAWAPTLGFLLVGLVALFTYGRNNELPRSLEFVYNVFFEQRYKDLFDYVTWEGGIRVVSLLGSYPFGINHPFGWGLGSWPQASINSLLEMGISEIEVAFFDHYTPYDGFRPTAFSADLFLETGVFGWLLFAWAFYPYVVKKQLWTNANIRAIVVLFLFNMLILGTIGDPLPFLFLALANRHLHHEPPITTVPTPVSPSDE